MLSQQQQQQPANCSVIQRRRRCVPGHWSEQADRHRSNECASHLSSDLTTPCMLPKWASATRHTAASYFVMTVMHATTKMRGRAQRVARPACANATVHFLITYRLAVLLPPSEWQCPFTSTVRILASLQSPPMQMHLKLSGVNGPKFTKFLP